MEKGIPRREIFPATADCVTPSDSMLFEELNPDEPRNIKKAKLACRACPQLEYCKRQTTQIARSLRKPFTVIGQEEVRLSEDEVNSSPPPPYPPIV